MVCPSNVHEDVVFSVIYIYIYIYLIDYPCTAILCHVGGFVDHAAHAKALVLGLTVCMTSVLST
jgi:hypothetical protein